MTEFSTLLQQGNAWLFIPSAILLGALHGLEPGHSKTMMAAFIVAIRGSVSQAVLLGLSATLSHTAVVWVVAMGGLYFGRNWDATTTEPWFQLISALLMIAVALWMLGRTWRHQQGWHKHHNASAHQHDHAHDHQGHHHHHAVKTPPPVYQDAHELAHANDIRQRFANEQVTTGQIILFGLTGGLLPCPASITVLLLCLQLKQLTLGATLVLCFSLGLALTLVAAGVLAATSARHVSRRWPGLDKIARKAPYASGLVIVLMGLYLGYEGLHVLI
jgi:ABC-type nickel/cobalt efflux system permease component RcnA